MTRPHPLSPALVAVASLLATLAGCDDAASSGTQPTELQVPPLPEAELAPALPHLREGAARAAEPPAEARMAELRDLLLTAHQPDYADERTQRLARRALDDADDAVWIFEEGLDHELAAIRSQSAWQLGQRGRVAAIPLLLRKLRLNYEPERSVECWLIRALVELGNHGGMERLVELMAYPDSSATAYQIASQVLAELGRHPGEQATHVDVRRELQEVAYEWQRFGHVVETTVAEALANPQQPPALDELDPLLRARCMRLVADFAEFQLRPVEDAHFVFVRMGLTAVPFLDIGLRAAEDDVRRPSLEVLVELGRPGRALTPAVLPLLQSPKTSAVACRALGEIGAERALPYLLERLAGEDLEARASAAAALGPLGEPRALPPLLERMRDEEEFADVRVQAAYSVALLDPGVRFLKDALDQGDAVYHPPTLRELIDEIAHRVPR